MDVHGRFFGAFRSDVLKKNTSLPHHRFSDLDRAELNHRLERLADVRAAVVARGRALVANPQYPEPHIVQQVSRLLAAKLFP
jgi:hypothetical protein